MTDDKALSEPPAAPPAPDVAGLVEFLRSVNSEQAPYANDLVREKCHEAADALTAQAARIKQLESANSFLQRNFCNNHNQRKTAERQRDEARAMLAMAQHALEIVAQKRQCLDNLMSNKDVALEALAAIAAPGGGDGWLPIESNEPPHGEDVLLFSPPMFGHPNGIIEVRPYSQGHSGARSIHSWATHWRPLPAPPAQGGE